MSRSYTELAFPWPAAVARAIPFAFVDLQRNIEIHAADLSSAEFCAALDADVRASITRSFERRLEEVLADLPKHPWVADLVFLWTPDRIAHFSSAAQKRLAAAGLLAFEGPVQATKLLPSCVRTVADLVALLEVLQEPAAARSLPALERLSIGTSLPSARKRIQTNAQKLVAPQKWRPDPTSPLTLSFAGGVDIHHDDPRFSWWIHLLVSSAPPSVEIRRTLPAEAFLDAVEQDAAPHLAAVARSLRAGVAAAVAVTVQQEVEDIALAVGRACRDRARTATQISHRYGVDGKVRSLEDCASIYGVSRQTIFMQIQLSRALCPKSAFAPALRSVVTAVERNAGRPLDVVESELRQVLGPTISLTGALQFADDFLGLRPATHVHRMDIALEEFRPPGATHRRFVGPSAANRAHSLVWELQARLRASGFALVNDVLAASWSTESREPPATRQQLDDALASSRSIEWLDADQQWLVWNGDASPVVQALRQLVTIAHPYPLTLDVASMALRAFLDASSAAVHPPAATLRAAIPDLLAAAGATMRRETIVLREGEDATPRLPTTEKHVYDALATLGGYATWDALRSTCKAARGRSTPDFAALLRGCYFVAPWGPGFKLVGWPDPAPQLVSTSPVGPQRPYTIDGAILRITLTQSSAERVPSADRLLYLPRPLDTLVEGSFTDADLRWPDIKITNGRLYRVAQLAQALGVPDGGTFDLEINLERRSYRLHVAAPTSIRR